jgi:hypothetical protein
MVHTIAEIYLHWQMICCGYADIAWSSFGQAQTGWTVVRFIQIIFIQFTQTKISVVMSIPNNKDFFMFSYRHLQKSAQTSYFYTNVNIVSVYRAQTGHFYHRQTPLFYWVLPIKAVPFWIISSFVKPYYRYKHFENIFRIQWGHNYVKSKNNSILVTVRALIYSKICWIKKKKRCS